MEMRGGLFLFVEKNAQPLGDYREIMLPDRKGGGRGYDKTDYGILCVAASGRCFVVAAGMSFIVAAGSVGVYHRSWRCKQSKKMERLAVCRN